MPLIDDIDLASPDTLAAGVPHSYFTKLRNENPVYWHESDSHPPGFWVVTKYQDVIDIERDTKTYSSARGGALLDDQGAGTELMMLNQDPPQHTRLRNLVARGFTPKVIKGMEPASAPPPPRSSIEWRAVTTSWTSCRTLRRSSRSS